MPDKTLLERIDSPSDLKGLTYQDLERLAADIREELIKRVSANGGHLASNLGVVELTIALHRVLNAPEDKIVWDVGHQSYVHKLLTGRREGFATLRQHGGLCGFPDLLESPYDAFGTGHACTSVSAALGIALARDLAGGKCHVAAVIGDGAFSGGMAFEAVNHAGHVGARLMVVLNDNGMSISPSVGALSGLLNLVRLDSRYEQAKEEAKRTLARLPLGETAWAFSKRLKGRLKKALVPGAFWEELGFVYLGPVDGHNIKDLEAALSRARDHETRPTLIHVLTQKGKGYAPAEADATRFHGVSPPKPNTAVKATSYSEVFGQTVLKLMRENNRVVAITAAMLDATGLGDAAREFPDRVFDVGICEQHAVTMAAGLATQGYVPIVAIYSTFLQRAYDQIIHDVCLQNLPVVFALDRAGIVGDDGKTHQGAFDVSYLRSIPNMVVAAPKDERDLQDLLVTAVSAGCPMAVRYPRGSGRGVPLGDPQVLPLGKAEILRHGDDVAILALGSTVYPALNAAERLAAEGIQCGVVNARFAKPLDADLILGLAGQGRRVVTVEENVLAGGFGSAVLQLLNDSDTAGAGVECIGLPDRFVEHGPQELFRSLFDLDGEGIARRVKKAFPDLGGRIGVNRGVAG